MARTNPPSPLAFPSVLLLPCPQMLICLHSEPWRVCCNHTWGGFLVKMSREIQLSQWRTQDPPLAPSLVFCSCYCRSATTVAESAIYGPLEHDGCTEKRKTQGREYGLGAAMNGAEQVPCSLCMYFTHAVSRRR
ncbi:hypothetical protein CDEST_06412 [Colletotrichum destructivum]|uniref:Secreted protein n=1 Tax=Colletotrichum destructivum TaxID=34406 RepID=A0AAX4IF27_9PEZI|nr:hypothetical protein CDEST_06412 [Colletotrichum destructivum]